MRWYAKMTSILKGKGSVPLRLIFSFHTAWCISSCQWIIQYALFQELRLIVTTLPLTPIMTLLADIRKRSWWNTHENDYNLGLEETYLNFYSIPRNSVSKSYLTARAAENLIELSY